MQADTAETFVTAAANSVPANASPAVSVSDGERDGKTANRRSPCRRGDMTRQSRDDGNGEHCSATLIPAPSLLRRLEQLPEDTPPPKQWTLPDKSPRLSAYSDNLMPIVGRSTFVSRMSTLRNCRRKSSTAPPVLVEDGSSSGKARSSSLGLRSNCNAWRGLRAATKVVGSLQFSLKQSKQAALVQAGEQAWIRLRALRAVTRKFHCYGRLGSRYSDDEESSSDVKSEEEGSNRKSSHGLRRTGRRRVSRKESCNSSAIWSDGSDQFRNSSDSSWSVESSDEVKAILTYRSGLVIRNSSIGTEARIFEIFRNLA